MALAILTGCAPTAELTALKATIATHGAQIEALGYNAASANAVAKKLNNIESRLDDMENAGCSCEFEPGSTSTLHGLADINAAINRAEAAARKCEAIYQHKLRKSTR